MASEIANIEFKWLNDEKLYKVYKNGKVFSVKENIWVNVNYDAGYPAITLIVNKKKRARNINNIVYELFISKIPSARFMIVNIDGNNKNNSSDNLKIIAREKYIRDTSNDIILDNTGENIEWKRFREYYRVYRDGRIYSEHSKRFLSIDYAGDDKNCCFYVKEKGIRTTYILKSTIYRLFIGEFSSGSEIKYKDGNNKNNSIDNLELILLNQPRYTEYDKNIWKEIIGFEGRYLVSKDGKVFSLLRNIEMIDNSAQKFNCRYKSAHLQDSKGIAKKYNIHQIVYKTYNNINITTKLKGVIDHIDRNKLNNCLDNLRLVSRKENSANYEKKPGIKQTHATLCDKFKTIGYIGKYNLKQFEINTYGQIRNIKNKTILSNLKHNNYCKVTLYDVDSKKYISHLVHRLVALVFIPNPQNLEFVNHKDRNRSNNCVSNLEWITPAGNTIHALGKKVSKYDINGNFIKTYDSISLLTKALGITQNVITRVCNNNMDATKKIKIRNNHIFKWGGIDNKI